MKLCPVILCGGVGTRLWPLSRRLYPKQFMDMGGHTLFGDTLKRIGILPDLTPPLVVCNKEQRFLAAAQMQEQGLNPTGCVILEPEGRNTAPAIAVAALAAQARNRGEDVLLLVLPSDHVIREAGVFARAVAQAAACADQGRLVTFGIEPDGPETGRFVEKPRRDAAEAMLAEGGHYWNSGMFLFRASLFLHELRACAPDMAQGAAAAWEERAEERDFTWLGKAFAACPADSIDYAVMEKTSLAAVVPLDAGWNDLGSWRSVYEAAARDAAANVLVGDVLAEDASGSYLHSSGRLVAALGVRNLVVVETGDAVLVADKERSQEVKNLVARLSRQDRPEKDTHLRVFRPWGWYETLALGERFQVKRIMVRSGASLSLQLHHQRAEHWVVVSGVGRITVGEKLLELHADQSTYIPLGVRHRLANAGPQPLEIIEIQSGSYLGEDDIVRFEDTYGRC